MNLTLNRFHFLIFGIIFIIVGLFWQNPIIGIIITLLLAITVFYDDKIPLLFLLIFIPVRPFLIVYNTGYKALGDILILFLLVKIIFDNRKNIVNLFRFNLLEIVFILFIAVGTISAFITGVTLPAIIMQIRAFLLFFLLFYIVRRLNINDKDIYQFSVVTFLTAVALSIQGIVEKISLRTLLLPEVWQNFQLAYTNRIRVYGLIGGPNELGLYLLIAFMVSFYLLLKTSGKMKIAVYFGMTLIFTVFLLTYSRGAILTLLCFLIIYMLVYKKIHYFKQTLMIVLAALSLFFAVVHITNYIENQIMENNGAQSESIENDNKKTGLDRFTGAFSEETIEMSIKGGRVYYVKKAIEVFKDKPIIGYGFGTFGGAATQTYSSPIYEKYDIPWIFYSDNQYIQILAETGIAGTILMAIFVIILIKITWNLRKGYVFSPLLIYFIVASISGSLVYNMLENDAFTMYYFMILGYAYQFLSKNTSVQP